LFLDGPRNFEACSDDKDDTWAGTALSELSFYTNGRMCDPRHIPHAGPPRKAKLWWNRVSSLDLPKPGHFLQATAAFK
ncbi:hypothetical protein AVEN_242441-1, partial [Araneus ventricosus]